MDTDKIAIVILSSVMVILICYFIYDNTKPQPPRKATNYISYDIQNAKMATEDYKNVAGTKDIEVLH